MMENVQLIPNPNPLLKICNKMIVTVCNGGEVFRIVHSMIEDGDSYVDSIHKHPLFVGLSLDQLQSLLSECTLKSYRKFEIILQSKEVRDGFMLILAGMGEVYVNGNAGAKEEVLEILQKGDVIGLSGLADFLGETVQHEFHHNVGVRSLDDTVCLDIPFHVFEQRWHVSEVQDYILRQISVRLKYVYSSLAEQVYLASQFGESEAFIRRVQDLMVSPAISLPPTAPIHDVAALMAEQSISSILIIEQEQLVGIITESDLIKRLLARGQKQQVNYLQPISTILTPNPVTISRESYYYEALSMFLSQGIKHLPVMDGTKVVGMLTLSDLTRKKNRGMMEVLQRIEDSAVEDLSQVKQAIYFVLSSLLKDGLPIIHILEVVTSLYDRLVKRCIQLSITSLQARGLASPNIRFCWYQMGSSGRAEQFILSDQDHFLVYEDVDHLDSEGREQVHRYFAELTKEIVEHLQKAGFALCPGKMMASEPEWRGTVSEWRERLRRWTVRVTNENLLLAHNFFAFRFLIGDNQLHKRFIKQIREQIERSTLFLYRLATEEKENPVPILDQPIRALFRLDRSTIDLKKEVLFPFHHSLELLSLQYGILEGTPVEKIELLKELHVLEREFAEDLREAYITIMGIRVQLGWKQHLDKEPAHYVLSFSQMRTSTKEEFLRAVKLVRHLQLQALSNYGINL